MSADFSELLNSSKFAANRTLDSGALKSFETNKLSQFQDIFKSSEDIWNRKQLKRNDEPQKFGGVSGIFNASAKSVATRTAAPQANDYDTNTIPANYNVNSAHAIEGYVNDTVERTRFEAERVFLNQHIFEANQVFTRRSEPFFVDGKENATAAVQPSSLRPLDSYVENVFAKKIEEAFCNGGMERILPAMQEAVQEVNDPAIQSIWDKIFAICGKTLLEGDIGIDQLRASKVWMQHVVQNATEYLEIEYKLYMEGVIEGNLQQAERGGIPGTMSLIEAFLNVAKLNHGKPQNDPYGRHPVWCVLFQTIRLGDYGAAATVAEALSNVPSCSILISCVNKLAKDTMLDHSTRIKLYAEWNHEERTCTDIFKRAVYGLFLDFDCTDVNDSVENWLWAKLISVKFDTQHALDRFQNLQRLVTVEYGEDYFLDEANGGSSVIYFSALLLSGQIERAIEILHRSDMPVFATHLAILSYTLKLLVLTDKVSDPLFTSDPTDPTFCKFNFARIVILYVKRFEMINISYAINYCFFLNKLYLDTHNNEDSTSLFEACVSRLVYVSNQADAILGKLSADGVRVRGLLDRFTDINVTDVISRVALDTSLNGDNLTACSIYCLAGKINDALKLMNRHLSVCIISMSPQSEYSVRVAEKLLKRYSLARDPAIEKYHLSTLDTLIRCYTIFRLFKNEQFEDVLNEADKAEVVPLDPDVVSREVERFKLVPEEIRNLLPDLCLILMKCTVHLFRTGPPPTKMKMRKYSSAILLFVAALPYRFPTAINSLLLQLQAEVQ